MDRKNRNNNGPVAKANVCWACPHRSQCAKLSALTLPQVPGYIPLGEVLVCPDGFVERVLESELPGPNFDSKRHREPAGLTLAQLWPGEMEKEVE